MPQAPTLSPEEVQKRFAAGDLEADTGAETPPVTADEVNALMKAGRFEVEGAPNTQAPATAQPSTPGFMDRSLPGITSTLGITPRSITRAIGAGVDTITGAAKTGYDIVTDPKTYTEPSVVPFASGAMRHLVVKPAIDQAQQSATAAKEGRTAEAIGHGAAAVIPVAGPAAAHIGERIGAGEIPELIGETGAGILIGKGTDMASGLVKNGVNLPNIRESFRGPTTVAAQVNDLATLSKSTGWDTHRVQPFLQKTMQDMKLKPADIVSKEAGGGAVDGIGDLRRGVSKATYDRINSDMKRIVDLENQQRIQMGLPKIEYRNLNRPIIMEIAARAVAESDLPFELAEKKYGDLPIRDQQIQIEGALRQSANETTIPALKRSYLRYAEKVKAEGGTFAGIRKVMRDANKEADSYFKLSPGGQSDATGPVAAASDLGNLIRDQIYPFVEQKSGGLLNLREAGLNEKAAASFRDGTWKSWNETAVQHSAEANRSTLSRMLKGVNPLTQNKYGMAHQIIQGSRFELPLSEFNRLFRQGVGGVRDYMPPPQPKLPGTMSGTQLPGPLDTSQPGLFAEPGLAQGTGGSPVQDYRAQQSASQLTRPPTQLQLGMGTPSTPPPVAIQGEQPITQSQQVRGVEATPYGPAARPEAARTTYPETSWNRFYTGEAETSPMRKPAGPGTLLTRDPKVAQSTLNSIDQILQNKMLRPEYRAELMKARATLMQQMQLQPPPTQ